ncbi:FAD dependent oxidoreductase [Phlegmacium glaucopus]|nr:FAD dependent oxidoreductase [Phlegmacium glaucopus]
MTREIVIIGGGIIGCTTAYYLTRHPSYSSSTTTITLIEASRHGPAHGASGKAGGLVARWAYPKELVDLSFEEHVKLAEEHNGKDRWGWRYVGCGSWEGRGEAVVFDSAPENEGIGATKNLAKTLGLSTSVKPIGKSRKSRKVTNLPEDLLWVKEELTDSYSPMARDGDTGQVHPYLFTTSMFELAKGNGVNFIQGKAVSIVQNLDGQVTGIEYVMHQDHGTTTRKEMMPATHVVVAAGAWSPTIVHQLPLSATRAHSITIRPREGVTISPYVLFTEISDPSPGPSEASSPEIYARPDNEVYACGPGDDWPLPNTVDDVVVDQPSCELIYAHVSSISQELREGTVEKRQACYLPSVSSGGGPIIGEADQIAKGLFVATGHTLIQGISNAPGTAKALTELIMDGKISCANLKKLRPSSIF